MTAPSHNPTPTIDRPTVIFIGGSGRSGSTLLERLLGEVPGVATLGEVVHLPSRGLVGEQTCGCGQPLVACPFWGPVGEEAFGGWSSVDGHGWVRLQGRVDRNRHLPALAVPVQSEFRHDLRDHLGRLEDLYRAAAKVSQSPVLVDSSKHASTAFLLRHARTVDVRYVHIVRDSRGVAYSWTKEVARPETTDNEAMPTYSPVSAAAWWDAFNVMLGALRPAGAEPYLLRYEDLMDDPSGHVRSIVAATGLALEAGWDDFLTPDGARLGPSHSVAGNPMRFQVGTIALRRDETWRERLPSRDRRVVTALSAPLLAWYGYIGRRK